MTGAECGRYRLICFTDSGLELMKKILTALRDDHAFSEITSLSEWTKSSFEKGNVIVFIGACGIAVRAIAPYVTDKVNDPAVIVTDEKGRYVIPVLSGHIGGGVDAAKMIAEIIGGEAVITTATDTEGLFAVDVFASDNDLVISDMKKAARYTADLLKSGTGYYHIEQKYSDHISMENMPDHMAESKEGKPNMLISPDVNVEDELVLIPRIIVVGMGCKKGKSAEELNELVSDLLKKEGIDKRAVAALVSADIKKDEPGLIGLSEMLGVPFFTYDAEELMAQEGTFSTSDFVKEVTGTDNVCERALFAHGCSKIISQKYAQNGMTIALGIRDTVLKARSR